MLICFSLQTANVKLAPAKKDPKVIAKSKFGFVNHDLAITVQRISDCKVVAGISPQNVHFIIAYRFPSWDVTKLATSKFRVYLRRLHLTFCSTLLHSMLTFSTFCVPRFVVKPGGLAELGTQQVENSTP